MEYIFIQNPYNGKYFFTIDHCQPHELENFVPCTVETNKTPEQFANAFQENEKEIANPNPAFVPKWRSDLSIPMPQFAV